MPYLPEDLGRHVMTATMLGPGSGEPRPDEGRAPVQVVEVGNLLPLYFPAELPNMALAGELSLTRPTAMQAMGAR
jgi:TRAP-type transport system periplasmic protein